MKKFIVIITEGDTQGNRWSYPLSMTFNSIETASEELDKYLEDARDQLIEDGYDFLHDIVSNELFLVEDETDHYLICAGEIFPIEVVDPQIDDVRAIAIEAGYKLSKKEEAEVREKLFDYDYSDYNNYILHLIEKVIAKRAMCGVN